MLVLPLQKEREGKKRKERKTRKERKGEKKREKERKGEKKMSRVNYYQYAINSQKEKLTILTEMLKISKSGCADPYTIIEHYHHQSSCRS